MTDQATAPASNGAAASNGASASPPAAPAAAPSASSETESSSSEYVTRGEYEALKKDLIKMRRKLGAASASSAAPGDHGQHPGTTTEKDDALAEAILALASDDARDDLAEAREAGASPAELLRLAKALSKRSKSSGQGDPRPPPPKGQAATAAPLHAPKPTPKTQAELFALATTDRAYFDELMSPSSSFDPSVLPRR